MKTQYNVEIFSGREETIDLSMFSYATGIIESEVETEGHFFFNIVMQGGVTFSVIDIDRAVLEIKRVDILKAREKFMHKFYKHMASLNAANTHNSIKKENKKRKKNIKKEMKLLRDIHYTTANILKELKYD